MINESVISGAPLARVAVSRTKGLERAVLRMGSGLLLGVVAVMFVRGLNLRPSGASNRITEYSLVVVMIPLAIAGLTLTIKGLRWLLLAIWPGRLEIVADADGLTFYLGPMGTARYPADQLDVRYLFELPEEIAQQEGVYEAFLEPSEQIENHLPRIRMPGRGDALEEKIMHYASQPEKSLADTLRTFLERIRRNQQHPSESSTSSRSNTKSN